MDHLIIARPWLLDRIDWQNRMEQETYRKRHGREERDAMSSAAAVTADDAASSQMPGL